MPGIQKGTMVTLPRLALCAGLLACALGGSLAFAQAAPTAVHKPAKVLRYLTADDVAPERSLPPPPNDPALAKAELDDLHRIIATRTPERLAQAKWDDEHENAGLYGPMLGKAFDLKALPATAELMAIVEMDAEVAGKAAKAHFARKRPWAVDASIPTCDPDDKPTTSYPSGHAMIGYSTGLVLADLLPQKAEAILTRAQDYAFSREVCGSHFATDTQASQALASTMVATLKRDPGFRAKLEASRAELHAAGLVP
jgi:acid phosphatase (class A)